MILRLYISIPPYLGRQITPTPKQNTLAAYSWKPGIVVNDDTTVVDDGMFEMSGLNMK